MHAAIYLRVSTPTQASEGVSLAAQEHECRLRAVSLSATSITVYRDEGISGLTDRRPGFQSLLAALPQIDVLIVWALDRLSRVGERLTLLDRIIRAGVRIVSLYESVDVETADGRLQQRITGALSEYQPARTSERVRSAMRRIAETGRHPAGAMFGYDRDAAGQLVASPTEAPLLREIFRRYIAGEPTIGLVRWLNAQPIRPKRGARVWSCGNIRRIIDNVTYRGDIAWGGVTLPGTYEALVSRADWSRAHALRDSRRTNNGRAVATFSPLFRCGFCGGYCEGRKSSRGHRYLSCRDLRAGGSVHPPFYIREDVAVLAVYRHTELLLTGADLRAAIADVRRDLELQSSASSTSADLQSRLDDLARRRRLNLSALHSGAITEADLLAANEPLIAEETSLRASLSSAARSDDLDLLEHLATLDVPSLLDDLRSQSVENQVGFLRTLYPLIELRPGELTLHHLDSLLPPFLRPLPRYYSPTRGRPLAF